MIKIQTSVKGIPLLLDILEAIRHSKANIHSIDINSSCTIVGQNVQPLGFHLMQYTYHIGPKSTHMFIEVPE
jgi:hypothetical protein